MPAYPVAASRNRNFGVASFAGAYDAIPSITAAYGMRRLRTAYTGSLLRIRRSSDNTESNIGYTADGHLDTAAVTAFVGGGSGYIVIWYDQSGNGYNATQPTAARQPSYVASGKNGRPIARWTKALATNLRIGVVETYNLASADGITVLATYNVTETAGQKHLLKIENAYTDWVYVDLGDSNAQPAGSGKYFFDHAARLSVTKTDAFGAWYSLSAWRSGDSRELYRNGVSIASGSSAASLSNDVTPLATIGDSGGSAPTMDLAEMVICSNGLSVANRQAAEAAANAYWAVY